MIHRQLYPKVLEALQDARVVLIEGARQVGKSTLAQAIANEKFAGRFYTLDDLETRRFAQEDPKGFINELKHEPGVIDEAQRSPDLLLAIKQAVDQNPKPGRFLLTGSANIMRSSQVFDALTGRIEILSLWPFSQSELNGRKENVVDILFNGELPEQPTHITTAGRNMFAGQAITGGYPEVQDRSEQSRKRWLQSYLRSTLRHDLEDIATIRHLEQMPRLMQLIMARAGTITVWSQLGKALGIDEKTVKSYTYLLESLFLIKLIPAWSPGFGPRATRSPKLYICDTGLLSATLGIDHNRITKDHQLAGAVFENFVAMELIKQLGWATTQVNIYHYRDREHHEVDLVLENSAGQIVAIEIKAGATIHPRATSSLQRLRDNLGEQFCFGVVIYTGERKIPLSERIWALPVNSLY